MEINSKITLNTQKSINNSPAISVNFNGVEAKDTFEKGEQMEQNENYSEMSNLQFKTSRVVFFPEDVEKMKTMSIQEKAEYALKLKLEGKYTTVKE